ncbi:hypothetical protein FQN49_004181 [Arthroderma sp. PD_2]|nr:hypothetical protein FQN49_004181 [Arthroderma sp. PD_2]
MELYPGTEVLKEPLPQLFTRTNYQTGSSALHNITYKGNLAYWPLADAVKKAVNDSCTNPDHLSAKAPRTSMHPCSIDRENYLCGDEQSVCGRFAQNALGPVAAVAYANGIKTRFGDFKVCDKSKGEHTRIPDFVAVHCPAPDHKSLQGVADLPQLKLVGEAKTPWKHDLQRIYNKYHDHSNAKMLPRALGQIAEYMHRYSMTYGFLTTYDHTIFLMQKKPDSKSHPILYYSRPIPHDASTNNNKDVVSVRQCLYYLLYATRASGFETVNTCPLNEWVSKGSKDLPGGPNTPYRGLPDTPGEAINHLSPQVGRVYSDTELIELHHVPHMKMLTAVLQFHPDQIHGSREKYVKIRGQKVGVLIKAHKDNKDHDSSSENSGRKAASRRPPPSSYQPQQAQSLFSGAGHDERQSALYDQLKAHGGGAYVTDRSRRQAEKNLRGQDAHLPVRVEASSSGGAYSDDSPSHYASQPRPSAPLQPPRTQGMPMPYRPAQGTDKGKAPDRHGDQQNPLKGKGKATSGSEPERDDVAHGKQSSYHTKKGDSSKDKKSGGFFGRKKH